MSKKNELTNNLSRRNNYMKNKKKFNHRILQINKNETLFTNYRKITTKIKIMKNKKKQFSIHYKKLQILNEHIYDYTKKHHDELLQNHLKITKTLQFLRQHC